MPPTTLVDLCKEELWARRYWDEPPQLYMVQRNKLTPVPLPVPERRAVAPADVLEALARGANTPEAKRLSARALDNGCLGFAFRVEAWMTMRDLKDVPGFNVSDPATHTYGRVGGQPSQAPDRVEIRVMSAATTSGQRLACIQRRDSGYQVETVETHNESNSHTAAGRIPDALAGLVHALLSAHYEYGPGSQG